MGPRSFIKVQLLLEGHKNLSNLPHGYSVNVKIMRKIAQIFVAFLEKLNFTRFFKSLTCPRLKLQEKQLGRFKCDLKNNLTLLFIMMIPGYAWRFAFQSHFHSTQLTCQDAWHVTQVQKKDFAFFYVLT